MTRRCRHCGSPIANKGPSGGWGGWFHTDVPNIGSAWCLDRNQMADVLPEHELVVQILATYEES